MEGLAAASSIAGVLSLAGQTVDGIVKLQGFFKDISSASRTIERFLGDINLLIKTIEDVRSLLGNISATLTTSGTDLKVIALEIQLQDCSKDVHEWLRLARDHHPGFSTGTKASFKKFWVAANKAGVQGISQEIKGHRHSLVASLSVLGRALDISNSGKLSSIHDKLEEAEVQRERSTNQLMKIDSIEEQSMQSLKYCRSSKSSLQRIASTLSRLERRQSELSLTLSQLDGTRSPDYRRLSITSLGRHDHIAKVASTGKNYVASNTGATNEPPTLKCIVCKRQFNRLYDLRLHIRAHDVDELFTCSVCGKAFALRHDWDHHQRAHPGEVKRTSSEDKVISRDESGDINMLGSPTKKKQTGRKRPQFFSLGGSSTSGDSCVKVEATDAIKQDLSDDSDDSDSSGWEDSLPGEDESIDESTFVKRINSKAKLATRKSILDTIISLGNSEDNGDFSHIPSLPSKHAKDSRLISADQQFQPQRNDDDLCSTTSSTYENISRAFDRGSTLLPRHLRSYVVKARLAETIKQEIALISLHANGNDLNAYLRPLSSMLASLEDRIKAVRAQCLADGHALYPIDEILTSCTLHDPSTGLLLPRKDTSARHGDILALRRKAMKLAAVKIGSTQGWTSKLDRINGWLFNNLQSSSDNAALHRSMLPDGQTLNEKSWARSVLKYWSIDEAAMGEEYLVSSSRGAVDSWGESCGIRPPVEIVHRNDFSVPNLIRKITMPRVSTQTNLEHAAPPKAPTKLASILAIDHLRAVQRH